MSVIKSNVKNYLKSKDKFKMSLKKYTEVGYKVMVSWNKDSNYQIDGLSIEDNKSNSSFSYISKHRHGDDYNNINYNLVVKAIDKSANKSPKWFDSLDYLMENKDLFDNAIDPVEHYLNHGIREGRNPSPFFSEQKYLELNPDVKAAIQNKAIVDGSPLISGYMHYMEYGCREGRSPDGIFDEQKYLDLHQDLAQHKATGGIKCGFLHCIYDGLAEGRLGCADVYE